MIRRKWDLCPECRVRHKHASSPRCGSCSAKLKNRKRGKKDWQFEKLASSLPLA